MKLARQIVQDLLDNELIELTDFQEEAENRIAAKLEPVREAMECLLNAGGSDLHAPGCKNIGWDDPPLECVDECPSLLANAALSLLSEDQS